MRGSRGGGGGGVGGGHWEGFCRRFGVHHPTFATVFIQVGSAAVNTTFHFYYVKVFLNRYKISPGWFQAAQVLFMVWNSVNDPVFGMLQDLGGGWVRSRKKAILYSGPFYALSFLIFWFPWGDENSPSWLVGVHLILALFLYDGVFSFALLAWSALLAEISTDHAARVRALKYNQSALLIGVNVILVLEKVSNSLEDFYAFQTACLGLAGLAWYCCWYTGTYAPDKVAQVSKSDSEMGEGEAEEEVNSWAGAFHIARQVVLAPDFSRITAANFLQVCRSTAHLNFASIFTEGLIPRDVLPLGSWEISLFYGACTLVPQILFIAASPLINRHGCYRLLVIAYAASLVSGVLAFLCFRHQPLLIMAFMFLDSILVHSFSPMFNLLFIDFIDDDMERHGRKSPISSIVFSLNALFTKPAQSLAPMAIVAALNLRHYQAYNEKRLPHNSIQLHQLQGLMLGLLTLVPAVLGGLQLLCLRRYSLRLTHRRSQSSLLSPSTLYPHSQA